MANVVKKHSISSELGVRLKIDFLKLDHWPKASI